MQHFILNYLAVNSIDASGLESLKTISQQLQEAVISLHLAEIKGPLVDDLKKTKCCQEMTEGIHFTHYDAVHSIDAALAEITLNDTGKSSIKLFL